MFTITTTASADKVTAVATVDGKRRQKTVSGSEVTMAGMDRRHGLAAGALLAVLTDDRQKAMLRHPSGGQRVRNDLAPHNPTKVKWTVSV